MNTKNNKQFLEHNMLMKIIGQLTDLNDWLYDENGNIRKKSLNADNYFYFSFGINGGATTEEYRKYYSCMEMITFLLNQFGIHIGNHGYAYILDSVKIVIDKEKYDVRLKSDIYPLLAIKYHLRNTDAAEHSIRNAINAAYRDYLRHPGCNKMGVFSKRPTNKQFILYIADEVLKNLCAASAEIAG